MPRPMPRELPVINACLPLSDIEPPANLRRKLYARRVNWIGGRKREPESTKAGEQPAFILYTIRVIRDDSRGERLVLLRAREIDVAFDRGSQTQDTARPDHAERSVGKEVAAHVVAGSFRGRRSHRIGVVE